MHTHRCAPETFAAPFTQTYGYGCNGMCVRACVQVINENGLELLVKNEGIMRDDVLGRAHCDLASVRLTGCDRQKVPVLCHKSSKQYGFVSVGLQFTPNSV